MSHVSENAVRNSPPMEELLFAFADEVGLERTKPSELAAYYIIGSSAFDRLLSVLRDRYRRHPLPPDPILKIKDAIIGKRISDDIPLLHELVNGPFDADKLDYLSRDARMVGVPVVTDIPRLIQKVRAVKVSQKQLPDKVARGVAGGRLSYVMTGVALSGARTLDELMLARTLLFDKIYRHQKVRAAESMVASLLECLEQLLPDSVAMLPYRLVDEQLLHLDPAEIQRLAGRKLSQADAEVARVAADIALRLQRRLLFVRVLAFSQHMPFDPYGEDQEQRAGLDALIRGAGDPQRRRELVGRIASEVRTILSHVERQDLLDGFPPESLPAYIRIDPPEAPSHGSEIYNAYLVTQAGELRCFKEDTAEARGWTDAYPLARDLGYLFSVSELAPYAALAAERIARMEFGVRIPRSMGDYTKLRAEEMEGLRNELAESGYYADAPFDIQPVPLRLTKADVDNRVSRLAEDLRSYAGPSRSSGTHSPTISKERIVDWLRQFSEDDVISAALDLVAQTRLIGRDEVGQAVQKFVRENPEFHGALMCPLGEPKDSSAICTYQACDLVGFDLKASHLADALALAEARPLLFVDDFIGSGSQAISVMESWLGVQPMRDLHETRGGLAPQLQEALRNRRLGFVFAAGMDDGVAEFSKRMKDLDLTVSVSVMVMEAELPVAFPPGELSAPQRRLLERCREVGRALLADGDPRHSNKWIEERILGYGNRAFLVVFPYNTPTQTLTCLWAEGLVDRKPWFPLFPRRKKI